MATISSAGIGSGLDVNSIISQLVALERQPIEALRVTQTRIQTQISSYGRLQSALAKLQDASEGLGSPSSSSNSVWGRRTAVSPDATVLEAVATGSGAPPAVSIRPTALSAAQTNTSGTFATRDAVVGTGTLTFSVGTWTGTTAFTPTAGTSSVNVSITAADNTLDKIAAKINAANAGVDAAVIYDGAAYRLSITSKATGAANGFRITALDSDGSHTNGSGLSRLTYNPPGGTSQMARSQAAANATAIVNGVTVTSASDTFDQAIGGLSFTVKKTSTTALNIGVGSDKASMKTQVESFVAAYNEMNKLARELTRVDAANPSGNGALQGDRSVVSVQSQLRSLLSQGGASTVLSRLADAGITAATDGTLTIDATKLDAALARPDEMRKLFEGNGPSQPGVATRFDDLIERVLGTDGVVASRTEGLRERLERSQSDQERLELRVATVERRLRAQYTALDRNMGQLNGLSSYVSQQLEALNNFYNQR
jgi:flagellar hook-associated protein 2